MTETSQARIPQLASLELDLLASLMADFRAWDQVADILTTAHFAADTGMIYDAVGSLVCSNRPCTSEAVAVYLQRSRETREIGARLHELMHDAKPGDARALAKTLHEEYTLSCIRAVASSLLEISDPGAGAAHALQVAAAEIERLTDALPMVSAMKSMESLVVQRLDAITEAGESAQEVPRGAPDAAGLNPLLALLKPGHLIGLCGDDSTGKTTLSTQLFSAIGITGEPALFASMEMPSKDIVSKVLATTGNIRLHAMTQGALTDVEWSSLTRSVELLRAACETAFLDDSEVQTLSALAAKCGRLRRQWGKLRLVVVDHLTFMALEDGQTHETVANGLKAMARALDCTVLVLSHSDVPLRKSADVILKLLVGANPGDRRLGIAKGRRGEELAEEGFFNLTLHGATATFMAAAAQVEHVPAASSTAANEEAGPQRALL